MGVATGAVIAMAAAAALSATAQIAEGKAAANEAKAQAALREQQAQRQREVAAYQEDRMRRDAERVQGAQRARLAAAGIDPAVGTALLLQEELAGQSEFNVLLARAQGEGEARLVEHQARIDRLRGRNAQTAGYVRAGSTLLTSASRAMGSPVMAGSSARPRNPDTDAFLYSNYRTPYD